MRIYKVFEINDNPTKELYNRELHFGCVQKFEIWHNDIYFTAEVEVEGNLKEEVTDEEFDQMVEEKIEEILETLKIYGRYPEYGVPKYVMI